MAKKKRASVKKRASRKAAAARSIAAVKIQSPTAKVIGVKHLAEPPKFIRPKRIHPRRGIPMVPEGEESIVHSDTPEAAFAQPHEMAAPAAAANQNLAIVHQTFLTALAARDTAGNVGEPSVAANANVVFYTGNWYAAVSTDGGVTFQFIDPAKAFRQFDPPNSHFCCDQVVQFIPQIDTFVWLLQYGPDTGDNMQRLAIAKTADVAQGRWKLFDITTASLGAKGSFLDFPDLAVGANMLYVTTNIFPAQGRAGTAVIRIPLSGIASGQITAQRFVSMDNFSFRVAQNCGTTAFFAAHKDTSTLRVFSWPENVATPAVKDVGIARYIGGNGYHSRTPDGQRWLDRADPRITGATLAGDNVWFAWGVNRGSNNRPKPFVQIAKIDVTNMTLVENINVFDSQSATCYGALGTNANGEVGISYMIGGGPRFPTNVVGILTGTRKDVVLAASDRGPLPAPDSGKGEWGDYLTVRRVFPNQKLFAATGYTLKGAGDGTNQDATPHFVIFGRASDV